MDRRGANCLSKAAGYTGIARVLVKAGSDGGKAQVKTKTKTKTKTKAKAKAKTTAKAWVGEGT